jgi:hypothetical protein
MPGIYEILMMAAIALLSIGVPIATLVLVYRIYRNTRK